MTHADQQSRLMRLLENYVNRKHEAKHHHKTAEPEKYSINTQDALSFYDKYVFGMIYRDSNQLSELK